MNRIDEMLEKWKGHISACKRGLGGLPSSMFKSRREGMAAGIERCVEDVREALKGCSVIEWRPRSELPDKEGKYLCLVEHLATGKRYEELTYYPRAGWFDIEYSARMIKWTELPERGGE